MILPLPAPQPIPCSAYWNKSRTVEHFTYQPTEEAPDPGPEGMIGMIVVLSPGECTLTHYIGMRDNRRHFKARPNEVTPFEGNPA